MQNGTYRAVIWIDDTKKGADGTPDERYLRRFEWGGVPAGMTEAAYLVVLRQEAKRQVTEELDRIADEGTPLAAEGQAL